MPRPVTPPPPRRTQQRAIDVVHLVWRPLGPEAPARFAAAYRRHPAGAPHQLVVVYNGFAAGEDRAPYEAALAGLPHEQIVAPAPVQDLAAYLDAARRLDGEYVCFLNSYSEPLAEGWLAKLHAHASRPEVGMVGATGSWESHHTLAAHTLAEFHDEGPVAAARRAIGEMRRGRTVRSMIASYLWMRRFVAQPQYEPFPNHHVRTNGFMLRRELLLDLRWPPIREKRDAVAFESGRDGLTRQIEARSLDVLLVGRDGEGYAPGDWWRSGIYRCGDQENLLIADNRTRQHGDFRTLDEGTKARIFAATWGPHPEVTAAALRRPTASGS
jgi:hypothetical protein